MYVTIGKTLTMKPTSKWRWKDRYLQYDCTMYSNGSYIISSMPLNIETTINFKINK